MTHYIFIVWATSKITFYIIWTTLSAKHTIPWACARELVKLRCFQRNYDLYGRMESTDEAQRLRSSKLNTLYALLPCRLSKQFASNQLGSGEALQEWSVLIKRHYTKTFTGLKVRPSVFQVESRTLSIHVMQGCCIFHRSIAWRSITKQILSTKYTLCIPLI